MQKSALKNIKLKPRFLVLNEKSIKLLKTKAKDLIKKLKKVEKHISHDEALNHIAIKYGFESWKNLSNINQFESKGSGFKTTMPPESYTNRQLLGAYSRFNNIDLNKTKNHIQFSIRDDTYNFLSESPKGLLEKCGLILDTKLMSYLREETVYYQGYKFPEDSEYLDQELIFRFLAADSKSISDVIDEFLAATEDFSLKYPPDLPMTIWINGEIDIDSYCSIKDECEEKQEDYKLHSSYFTLPSHIWRSLYQ